MANNVQGTPWALDTAPTVLSTARIRPKGLRWVGATAAGHECVIHDNNGRVKWRAVAGSANHTESDTPSVKYWHGFNLVTLNSGVLYVEF